VYIAALVISCVVVRPYSIRQDFKRDSSASAEPLVWAIVVKGFKTDYDAGTSLMLYKNDRILSSVHISCLKIKKKIKGAIILRNIGRMRFTYVL